MPSRRFAATPAAGAEELRAADTGSHAKFRRTLPDVVVGNELRIELVECDERILDHDEPQNGQADGVGAGGGEVSQVALRFELGAAKGTRCLNASSASSIRRRYLFIGAEKSADALERPRDANFEPAARRDEEQNTDGRSLGATAVRHVLHHAVQRSRLSHHRHSRARASGRWCTAVVLGQPAPAGFRCREPTVRWPRGAVGAAAIGRWKSIRKRLVSRPSTC